MTAGAARPGCRGQASAKGEGAFQETAKGLTRRSWPEQEIPWTQERDPRAAALKQALHPLGA